MAHELIPAGGGKRTPAAPGAPAPAELLVKNSGESARKRILEFFTARIRNPNTRRAYAQAVRAFLKFSHERGIKRLQDVDPVTVSAFIESYEASEPTKKRQLAALRHFFDWLVTGQVIPSSPAASVRGPKHVVTEGITPAFEPKQARKLLHSITTNDVVGLRDRAVVGILIYTAARAGAVAALRVGSFVPDGTQWVLKFREKGGKARKIPVRHDLEQYLREYIDAAGIDLTKKKQPLFRTTERRTKRLTKRQISGKDVLRMVKRRLKDVGLPENFCAHSFRATTITDLLKQGVPIEDVQYLAGHADKRTTGLYDRRKKEVTRNIVERISI